MRLVVLLLFLLPCLTFGAEVPLKPGIDAKGKLEVIAPKGEFYIPNFNGYKHDPTDVWVIDEEIFYLNLRMVKLYRKTG